MKKEITKLTKNEKAQIENKMLTTFTVALGSIMVILYLWNWFHGSKGFQIAAEITVYAFVAVFIALAVLFKIKSVKYKKENVVEKAKKFNNWFIFSIVGAVGSFLVYPYTILRGEALKSIINKLNFGGLGATPTRMIIIIALIAVYTIAVFVYWGIYLHKAHKGSLNKGKNK